MRYWRHLDKGRIAMQSKSGLIRNKLMLACALVVAAVLAAPAAMARGYRGHGDDSGKVLGALVVGAVIGGVIASASQHDRYDSGYYYPAQSYPPQGYYQSYPSYPAYSYGNGGYSSYPSYPAYSYGNGGYYSYPSYGNVNVGVVYSSRGGHGYYGGSHGYSGRGGYYGGSRGYHGGRSYGGRGGSQGHYYSRHGH
jgi:hypothetical protein